MNKHGEVSTSFLVSMILIILGFAVVAFVFFQFSWGDTVNKETCHSSVVLRGTLPDIAKSYSPLKCQTEKICLVKGESSPDCGGVFAGAKKIIFEEVSSNTFNKVENDASTEIEREISQRVVDCWATMGEGKISIENEAMWRNYGFEKAVPFCVICSRIAVDENLASNLGTTEEVLATVDPYNYMKTHKYPGSEKSYLDYLIGTGVGGKGASFSGLNPNSLKSFDEQSKKTYEENKKHFDEVAVVFMQISSPSESDVWDNYMKSILLTQTASYAISPGVTAFLDAKVVSGVTKLFSNPVTATITLSALAVAGGYIELNTLNNQALTASYCGDITSGGNAKKGCSVVRVVPYNANQINSYCGIIDGLP